MYDCKWTKGPVYRLKTVRITRKERSKEEEPNKREAGRLKEDRGWEGNRSP